MPLRGFNKFYSGWRVFTHSYQGRRRHDDQDQSAGMYVFPPINIVSLFAKQ